MTTELCHCTYRNQGYVYAVTPDTRCAECEPGNRQPFTAENVNRALEQAQNEIKSLRMQILRRKRKLEDQ